jgi:chorismate dehydratase
MQSVRIGVVRYLNTAPLIEGLDRVPGMVGVPAVPSHLAGMLDRGEVDIALASLVDASRHSFTILPVGMIGSDGPTLTVRLFSRVPIDRITRVFADTDSHTSVILCQLLLRSLTGRQVSIQAFDAREHMPIGANASSPDDEWPETLLLIGDKVVTDAVPAVRYSYQLDLGEAWKERTGLPFVYAAWMCKPENAGEPRVLAAAALLDRQLRHNLTRLDWIVAKRAPEARWPRDLARTYLADLLRYRLDERASLAAQRFIDDAASAGLLPGGALAWAFEPGTLIPQSVPHADLAPLVAPGG